MGCVSILLRGNRAYMSIPLLKSNKGWHKLWFNLRNDPANPLLVFSNRLVEEALEMWWYGPIRKCRRASGSSSLEKSAPS
jgi:hypothetical protein